MASDQRVHPDQGGSTPPTHQPNYARDFGASIVVFLVALPLCMGIAIASGAPIAAGLISGIIAGLVVGSLAGCPLQVSGPAAGLTVIVYEAIQTHGLKMLGVIVLIAGLIQLIAGAARIGQWFRAVSPAVVHGMLAGIGVLIFASQFHVMLDRTPASKGYKNLFTIPEAVQSLVHTPTLPEKDIRGEIQSILKELGELHRQQISLNEEVTEHIPNHYEKLEPDHELKLAELAPRQQAIIDALVAIQARGHEVLSHQPERQQKADSLANEAKENLAVVINSLEQDRGDLAPPAGEVAAKSITKLQSAYKNNEFAAAIGVMTILLLVLWTKLTFGPLKLMPAALIGVVAATSVAAIWQLPVLYVEIPTDIVKDIHFLKLSSFEGINWSGILVSATVIAVIASAETLLCATAVDSLQTGPRTNYNKELMSQGVGNMLCGFMGALPMTGVIVRSSANVQAGGTTRLSAILHGAWILVFVVFFASLLRMIPTSALAAILVYTGFKLVNFKEVKHLAKFGWSEVGIWLATVLMIVFEDLLLGVLTGLALSVLKMAVNLTPISVRVDRNESSKRSTVHLTGHASFLRIPKLAQTLEKLPPQEAVVLETSQLASLDLAALELLQQWGTQYKATGGEAIADWDALKKLAQSGKKESAHAGLGTTTAA
ncbi:SulP family inorganic anion transporter [Planctomicrobium sp. SH668]|uniref:SulP family inorganic anion transporter n=1 Tax=Planctomicrobium sp. SH668 TaxID=3448126 RepID=UPI003F5C16CD